MISFEGAVHFVTFPVSRTPYIVQCAVRSAQSFMTNERIQNTRFTICIYKINSMSTAVTFNYHYDEMKIKQKLISIEVLSPDPLKCCQPRGCHINRIQL